MPSSPVKKAFCSGVPPVDKQRCSAIFLEGNAVREQTLCRERGPDWPPLPDNQGGEPGRFFNKKNLPGRRFLSCAGFCGILEKKGG